MVFGTPRTNRRMMTRFLCLVSTVTCAVVTGFSPLHPHHRGTTWLTRKVPTVGTTQLYLIDEKAVTDSVQILQKSIVEKPKVVNVLPADKVVTKAVSTPPPLPPAPVPPSPPVETTTPPPPIVEAVVTVPAETVSVPDVLVPPEVTTVIPDVVPETTTLSLPSVELPSVDLPSIELPEPSALLDSLPVGDFPILAIVGVFVVAVIAALSSLGKSGDETAAEPASAPAVTTTTVTAPAAVVSSSEKVDLSVPYDAAARIAYDEWRVANNKGGFDAAKFTTFQTNYELVTVANVSAKDKARKTGETPSLQTLGADADTTIITLSTVA